MNQEMLDDIARYEEVRLEVTPKIEKLEQEIMSLKKRKEEYDDKISFKTHELTKLYTKLNDAKQLACKKANAPLFETGENLKNRLAVIIENKNDKEEITENPPEEIKSEKEEEVKLGRLGL